jgi:excisionase family DNA binding protein
MVLMVAEEQWLTVEQVAERLQVHIETVRRWIRSGDLPGVRLGRRAGYRVKAADLDAFLDKQYRRGP